jgi:hypothetical protein
MAANKIICFEPVALTTTTTTNIWSPPTTSAGTGAIGTITNMYFIFRHIRVVNVTNGAIFVALWRAASAANTAGKEFIWGGVATAGALNANTGVSCPANSFLEWFGLARLDTVDTNKFIVGGASALGLTIEAEGELGVT